MLSLRFRLFGIIFGCCSAWSKTKLNTEIGLHTTTTTHTPILCVAWNWSESLWWVGMFSEPGQQPTVCRHKWSILIKPAPPQAEQVIRKWPLVTIGTQVIFWSLSPQRSQIKQSRSKSDTIYLPALYTLGDIIIVSGGELFWSERVACDQRFSWAT